MPNIIDITDFNDPALDLYARQRRFWSAAEMCRCTQPSCLC